MKLLSWCIRVLFLLSLPVTVFAQNWATAPTTTTVGTGTGYVMMMSPGTLRSMWYAPVGGSWTMAGSPSSGSMLPATITFNSAGNYQVKVVNGTSSGGSAYGPAVAVTVSAPSSATTFAPSPTSFTYNGAAQGPSANPTPSTATYSTSGTSSATNVGSYTVQYTATGSYSGSSGQVSWSIVKASQSITFNNPGTQTSGSSLTLNASASSGLSVTYSVTSGPATLSGNTLTFTGTGTVTVKASQGGNSNYNAASDVSQSFTVNPPDPNADSDGDGVPNNVEQQLGTNPNSAATTDSSNTAALKIHKPQ